MNFEPCGQCPGLRIPVCDHRALCWS